MVVISSYIVVAEVEEGMINQLSNPIELYDKAVEFKDLWLKRYPNAYVLAKVKEVK